ncbi:Nucleoporin [Rhizoctonia solani]|uniref:Nucleoporin n=1 Tax=Rhizoctonia solani TaxID=456999 RepID=A0A8H7IL14_9AGAM|nr:Nucleoporin [Rhizoctonia solani]
MSSVVYTHISGLSTNIVPIEIPSQEQHEGREEPEGFVEHGEYATTIHAHDAGTVLLRVLDGGHMLELMALESGMRAARFSFASKIALQPALMMLGIAELHVLVVTLNGSIFRLRFVLPHLWNSTQYAPKEYRITSISAPIDGIVHVPEVGVVFIGLNDGGVLRLTAKMNGLEYTGDWTEESLHGPPNYFPSFSSLMPSFYSGPTAPDPSKIIALASIPPPLADSGYARATSLVATLSRDRHLRVWLTGNGKFVASKQIPSQFFQTDALITRSATPGKTPALEGHIIDSDYRPIIRVLPPVLDEDSFSPDMDAGTEVIVFMPTPGAETAGFFLLYRLSAQDRSSSRRDLNFVGRKPCSAQTEGWELRDFLVADDVLYLLWNSQGRTVIQTSTYDLDETEAEQEPWNTLSADGEKELSPDSFEESTQEGDTLASSILAAILRPGASPRTHSTSPSNTVVGSSVSLTTDPRTGAQMWDRYWSALRRDWEGFVARCQAVERAGRWPLGLSRARDGSVVVLARERMGTIVALDEPMSVHSLAGANTSSSASLFGVAWSLRANIPSSELRQLEDADVAQRHLDGLLPDGPAAFVRSGLGMIGDPEDAVSQALDVVGKLEHVVKLEDPDGGMGLAIGHDGEFKKALTTAYIAQSIEARYDLCLSILLLLLFIALDNPDTLKSSVAAGRACITFHALGLLRSLTKQSAGDLAGAMGFASPAPGAIGVGRSGPQYSLVHSLLPRANLYSSVLQSAHAFIREAGVLSDVALLDAGPGTLGLSSVAVIGLPGLFEGTCHETAPYSRGLITHLTPNDQIALESNCSTTLAASRKLFPSGVRPLRMRPPILTRGMWSKVFRAYVDLAMWEDAYVVLVSTPYTDLHRENVRQLVIAMCEANYTDKLAHLGFVGHHVEVERTLSFKARHADPFAWPDYAKILYAWHVFRGDFRSAGAAMYERARRLGEEAVVEEEFVQVANVQARCYLAAINSLELVDPSHSWVLLSVSTDEDLGRKRRKLTVHIPEAKFNPDCKDFEVVQLSDMRQEHALVSARIELLGYYPELSYHSLSSSQDIVSLYVRANNFDLAFSTGRLVGADLGPAFVNLATQCMNLTASAELADNESIPWLETDQTLAWDGSTIQRAWHYLQLSLERHDVEEGDWSYRKAVADTVLELDQSARLPNWLVSFFLEKQPDYLVRLCLKYNRLQDALLYSVRMVKEATDALSVMPPRHASTTCLPYSLFDQLIIAASEPASSSEQKHLAETLKKDLAARLLKLQKWSAPR